MKALARNYLRKITKLEQDVLKKPAQGLIFGNTFGCIY